jgi:hypothetical protein
MWLPAPGLLVYATSRSGSLEAMPEPDAAKE